MSKTELELKPVDFITIGTIGPKGQRIFHLQAGRERQLVTFVIEKEQAWALAEAIAELVDKIDQQEAIQTNVELASLDMELREPIQPFFRVAQMGLAWDEELHMVILVATEMVVPLNSEDERDDDLDLELELDNAGEVRMWATLKQMRALSLHATDTVEQGRPSPRLNGRITYYWM